MYWLVDISLINIYNMLYNMQENRAGLEDLLIHFILYFPQLWTSDQTDDDEQQQQPSGGGGTY